MNAKMKLNIRKLKENLFVYSLIIYPLILFVIFYVIVNFNSIILAFQTIDGTGKHFAGLNNFKDFLQQITSDGSLLYYSMRNSLLMYVISLVVCMPLYIIFSYLLYKNCIGNRAVSFLVMIPTIMSSLVVSLVFVRFIGSNGPFTKIVEVLNINGGKWFSLLHNEKYNFGTTLFYMIWLSFSTSLLVYPTAMRGINPEIIESAQLDGATNIFQELWYIILPLIYPTLTTFLVTGIAAIFSNAGPILEFYDTSAPENVYNMGYYFMQRVMVDKTEFSYPLYAAGGLILTIVVAPITLFVKWALEKYGPTTE